MNKLCSAEMIYGIFYINVYKSLQTDDYSLLYCKVDETGIPLPQPIRVPDIRVGGVYDSGWVEPVVSSGALTVNHHPLFLRLSKMDRQPYLYNTK